MYPILTLLCAYKELHIKKIIANTLDLLSGSIDDLKFRNFILIDSARLNKNHTLFQINEIYFKIFQLCVAHLFLKLKLFTNIKIVDQ
tara:strand:+ start:529 stop:789 length:261 start_codon:yes stop_codon:yes gene_type:complete